MDIVSSDRVKARKLATKYEEAIGHRPSGKPWEMFLMPAVHDFYYSALFDGADQLTRSQVVLESYMLTMWGSWGTPVFDLTPNLVTALVLTECSGVRMPELRWPYPAFVLRLPKSNPFSDLGMYHNPTKAIYTGIRDITGDQNTLVSCPPDYEPSTIARLKEYVSGPIRQHAYIRLLMSDNKWFAASALIVDEDVSKWVHWAEEEPQDDIWKLVIQGRSMARRLVVNFLLYLEACKNDVVRQGKPPKLGSLRDYAQTWVVGREVKLSPRLHKAAKDLVNVDHDRVSWRVQSRFVVRGHWRNQACGAGRQERKRIWIQPYWKGPERAEALSRLYKAIENE